VSVRHNLEQLLSLGTSFQAFQVVFESVRLGLFETLAGTSLTTASIARRLRLSARALERLLRALVEMGLLRCRGGCYKNTAFTQHYLSSLSKNYIGDFFIHRQTLMQPWAGLRFSLAHNRMVKPEKKKLADYPLQLKKFMSAMDSLGRLKSQYIKKIIDIKKYRTMLDLGGGMGTYAVSFARENKKLQTTIFDLHDVIRHARYYIRQNRLEDRIQPVAGQCIKDELPAGPFDLVFISNLLHIYEPRECYAIIRKAARVLAGGGTMVVHDYVFGCGERVAVSLFDMTMLVGTPRGRCYERNEIERWMATAGIQRIQAAEILGGTSIVWGVKGEA